MAQQKNIFDRLSDALRSFRGELVAEQATPVKAVDVALSTGGEFSTPARPSGKQTDYIKAYAGWVYACVKARSTDVSTLKLHLFKANSDRTETTEVYDHDVLSLLRKVNPWMTSQELFEYTQAYKDLAGEAFWYIVRQGTRIAQIWPLRPDYMTIKTDKSKFIVGYTYTLPGSKGVELEVDEVVHFKEFNPVDPYRGMSVIRAAAISIDTEDYAEKYNANFFKNSAVPSVVLKTQQKLDQTIQNRMRAQWNNEYGGSDKSHKMAILEGGLDITPFQMTQKDMEFLGGMQMTRDKILAMFQVPKSRLGMTEGISVSNTDGSIAGYIKYTVNPLMRAMVGTLNEFLLPLYKDGEDLFLTYEDPTPENKEVKLATYQTLFSLGAITGNEIRQREGLETVDGLDEFYLPATYTNVNDQSQDEPTPVSGKAVLPKKRLMIPAKTMSQRIAGEVAEVVKNKVLSVFSKSIKTKQAEEMLGTTHIEEAEAEKYWHGYVEKAVNFEDNFKKRVQEVFDRQERNAIASLHKTQKALNRNDIPEILFTLSEENKVAISLLIPVLRDYFEEAGKEALDLVGSDEVFDMSHSSVQTFFKSRALQGIRKMNRVTRIALRSILTDAVRNGEGVDVTARNIRDMFGDAKKDRAERIARTEIMRAGNDATLSGYKQSGVVAGKQWFTALDERVCEWCGPMQGRVKMLDTEFFAKGEDFMGNQGHVIKLGFEAIESPPLHPNCRCVLLPIIGEQRSASGGTRKEIDRDQEKHEMKQQLIEELTPEITAKVKAEVDQEIGKIVDAI